MSKTIHNPANGSSSVVHDQVLYNESDGTAMTIQNGMVISVDQPLPRPADFVGPPRRTPIVNTPAETPYIAPTANYGDDSPSFAGAAGSALLADHDGEGESPYVAPTMEHSQAAVRPGNEISTLSR